MKVKKLLALALALAMILSIAATGCKAKEEETATESPATEAPVEENDETEAPVEENDETEAPVEENDETEEEATEAPATTSDVATNTASGFPDAVVNNDPSIEGGVLKYAVSASSGFKGLLNPVFYEDAVDAEVLAFFIESIFSYDESFVMDQDGAATYEYDIDAKTMTFTMREGVKWHDGEPVTLDDLLFAFEIICHKDYNGPRYDGSFTNIVGVEEYHSGTADTISGITLSDDEMSMTIQYIDFYPSILVGGVWSTPMPRHYWEGVEVKDMEADVRSRTDLIGFGPFKVETIVPGESAKYVRFDDYWLGTPKLDGVELTVVHPDLIPTSMNEGLYDIAGFSTQVYPDYMNPTNYQYIGAVQTSFNYTGFKLGTWDNENSTNIVDTESKMYNLNLRKAIGYAVDNKEICDSLYNGLRFVATTVITPRHGTYQNTDLEGYYYDPEKAKQLLDEAGYIDIDGDGFREDPNGEQFTIIAAMMDGQGADTIAQFKIQCWADVGLRVELYNGRLTEFNAFYDAVEFDDPAIDMYEAAWQTGFDPNPEGLWGRSAPFNYTRYTSDTFDAIIADISSDKAWDQEFLIERYRTWQETFFEEAPAIPTVWRIGLTSVNNRVKNYDVVSTDIELSLHEIELTADAPIVK